MARSKYTDGYSPVDERHVAELKVVYPPNVAEIVPGFKVIVAHLGSLQYGSTITATMRAPLENQYACEPYDNFFPANSIVIVEPGFCTFVEKARNIEQAGGQVAVVTDSMMEYGQDYYVEDLDGSGFTVSIPILLMDFSD